MLVNGVQYKAIKINNLEELMKKSNISIKELSELTGIPYNSLYNYKIGVSNPRSTNMTKICEIFNVTEKEFINTEEYSKQLEETRKLKERKNKNLTPPVKNTYIPKAENHTTNNYHVNNNPHYQKVETISEPKKETVSNDPLSIFIKENNLDKYTVKNMKKENYIPDSISIKLFNTNSNIFIVNADSIDKEYAIRVCFNNDGKDKSIYILSISLLTYNSAFMSKNIEKFNKALKMYSNIIRYLDIKYVINYIADSIISIAKNCYGIFDGLYISPTTDDINSIRKIIADSISFDSLFAKFKLEWEEKSIIQYRFNEFDKSLNLGHPDAEIHFKKDEKNKKLYIFNKDESCGITICKPYINNIKNRNLKENYIKNILRMFSYKVYNKIGRIGIEPSDDENLNAIGYIRRNNPRELNKVVTHILKLL